MHTRAPPPLLLQLLLLLLLRLQLAVLVLVLVTVGTAAGKAQRSVTTAAEVDSMEKGVSLRCGEA
jgi:hypothetical protein